MKSNHKKLFQYLYILFALAFIAYFFGNETSKVFFILGGIDLLVFAVLYFLFFHFKNEQGTIVKIKNLIIILFVLFISVSPILGSFVFPKGMGGCPGSQHRLYKNIFTEKVIIEVACSGTSDSSWYLKGLPWNDPRNPDPSLNVTPRIF